MSDLLFSGSTIVEPHPVAGLLQLGNRPATQFARLEDLQLTKECDPTKYPPTGAAAEKVSERYKMAELQNPKHEAFVQEYVKDRNGARSYKSVYGDVKGAAQSAKTLLGRGDVQERLVEVSAELAVRTGMSQDQIVQDLQAVYETGMANPERGGLAAAQQSKGQQAKILGYTDQKSKPSVEDLSDEEMVAEVRKATGDDRLADLWAAALKNSMGEDISADLDKIEANLRNAVAISKSNGRDMRRPTTPVEN